MSTAELIIIGTLGPIDLAFFAVLWRHRRAIDKVVSTAVNRWLVARHKPQDIGEAELWCFTCRKSWPCAEWAKLMDERQESAEAKP